MADVPKTFGSLLIGGVIAAVFSGVVLVQTFAYFKFYQKDPMAVKVLVFAVWFMDFCHTIFVTLAIWYYVIENFGKPEIIDYIHWSLALSIAFTAILTFLVHSFFVHRIHKLSKDSYIVSVPLGVVTCARLGFACLTTNKMIVLKSLNAFIEQFTWSFTTGLVLSALLDVMITSCLCFLLKSKQKKNSSLNYVLDSLILYAFESGSLTCAATFASLICWLTMKHNLIFMALHFVISKFYANSLLATLNSRKSLKHISTRSQPSSSNDRALPVMFPDNFRTPTGKRFSSRHNVGHSGRSTHSTKAETIQLQVNVEKSTMCTIDEGSPPTTSLPHV